MTSPAFCVIGPDALSVSTPVPRLIVPRFVMPAAPAVMETPPLAVERSNPAIWMPLAAVIVIEPAAVVGIARLV